MSFPTLPSTKGLRREPPADEHLVPAIPEQELLRIVTENARIGLVVVSPERRYLYANATYAEVLGLPSTGLVGRLLVDVLGGIYHDQVRPRLDVAFAGQRLTYELRRPTPEGDRYFAVSYEPTTVAGTVAFVVVVITEVTERRQMQADSSRFAAMVQSSEDAIIGKDSSGIVTSWNHGAEKVFGYPASEMVGMPITRVLPPDRQDEERGILDRIRRGETIPHFETERLTKDGRLISVSVTVSPIRDSDGNVIGASKVARDITERKKADEALRFQQAMLLTERELTLDGILVVDDESRVLTFNRRFTEMWEIPDDALATRADSTLLAAVRDRLKDPDGFLERVRQLYDRHDEVSRDEVELLNGRIFDRYSAPMRDQGGRYYGRVWYFRDVTEKKQAEVALREERDRAQRYLDTADVILLALDPAGRITLINRKGCDLLGWTEAELLGRSWIERCVPERTRGTLTERFENLLGGDLSMVENAILTKDGRERLIEWRNRVLRDAEGRIIGTFSSGTDITERHAAVEALRSAEERMRFAMESANVGIWDVDYATGDVKWSETLERHFGLEPGTFEGTFEAFVERVHPGDRAAVLEIIGKAMKSGSDFSFQHRSVWPDGEVRWLNGAGRILLDEDGKPVRGVGISIDLTERHSLEEQYHQAQKMEAVGRLAGGVAHDFNNLLTAILGRCELLLDDLGPTDPRRSDVTEIQRAGHSAAGLTRQLLAFSRKEIIELQIFDVNGLIRDLQKMLGRLIGEDVKVVLHLAPELAPIKADRGQVEQIVLNLSVNARDAMPNGGTLTITTENVELDDDYAEHHLAVRPGRYVALSVSDTGVGMSPEVQRRIFEPFFTTKEVGKGTGLGLATVHGIVTQCGGSVGVYSEVGRGSSFKVYFPAADGVALPASEARPVARATAGETVLLVEDADGLRELTQRLLERLGYRVVLAANAREAQQVFEEDHAIDLILTDVVMPGGSGPELTQELLRRRPALKVVYMSGYTHDAISHHGVLVPGIAFLQKPFTSEALGRKLREALDR